MDNDSIVKNAFYILITVALGFLVGYFCQPKAVIETTVTRVDTLIIEKPIPIEVEVVRKEYVYIPTPADTVVKEVVRVDSVMVAVEVERRVYQDSLYRAVVSGAVVGDIHPTLESMELYARSETRVVERNAPLLRPYISASVGREMMGIGGGISIKDRVDVGAKYIRVRSTDAVMFEASYRFDIKTK